MIIQNQMKMKYIKKKQNINQHILYLYNEEISVLYDIMNELLDNKEICNPILSLKTFKIIGIYNYF